MKMNLLILTIILMMLLSITGCGDPEQEAIEFSQIETEKAIEQETEEPIKEPETTEEAITSEIKEEVEKSQNTEEASVLELVETFVGYTIFEVDGGDLSGYREANVAVDIGFGDRKY